MEVQLSPEQQALIQDAIESGRIHRPADAAQEAFSLWVERERRRAEILAAVDAADASLAEDGGRPVNRESMQQLAAEVKRRGCARLDAELQRPRWPPSRP